jgi:xanthine dehydrogenase iron-sulfur cluster and FAD-binding subunit A
VADARELLAEHGDDAKALAGGQSLVPILALRLARFGHIVDLNRVAELAVVERADGSLRVGAVARQRVMERDPLVAECTPLVARATPLIGHFQIRNRGTVGGSLAHADPASEYPAVALALGAELEIGGAGGTRMIHAADFFVGTWTTVLEPDELLVAARFPVWPDGSGFAVEEVARRHGDFALAGAAVAVGPQRAGIALFGVGATPVPAPAAEQALLEGAPAADVAQEAVRDLDPVDDIHATAETRRRIARHVVERAVMRARAELESHDTAPEAASKSLTTSGKSTPVQRGSGKVTINGEARNVAVEPRLTLADFLREHCALTGTHLGCEHGVCGACTVLLDGDAVRSCLLFAVQADGADIVTVEGIAGPDGELSPVQQAFRDEHGLQCGFCTPGFVITATALLHDIPAPTETEIREALSGNICRCTGYQGIVRAVQRAASDGATR